MIDYVCDQPEGGRPRILKRLTASSGEQLTVEVLVNQEEERSHLTDDQIYEHLNALIDYIKDATTSVEVIPIDEAVGNSPWGLKGWEEVEWAKNEALAWWEYVYFRDENPHSHEENSNV